MVPSNRPRVVVPVIAVAVAMGGACSSSPAARDAREPDVATEAGALVGPRVRPAVDLASVMKHSALAYRADAGAFSAVAPTFEAKVSGRSLAIVPRRDLRDRAQTERGASLELETSLVARGGLVLASLGEGTPVLEADGAITIRRGDVTERIENDEAGVEQSWRFATAPRGDGDLVVRVRLGGDARFAKSSDHGLHFGAPSKLGTRYGIATWVDGAGERTVVVPKVVANEIVMTVPADIVARSTFPAVLDPTLTSEAEIDAPVSGSSASGEQYSPGIVESGPNKGYFAVWYDRRGVRPALYGARLASNGAVQDDTGVLVASGVGSTQPSIASSGNGYLVTWAVSYVDLYQSPGVYAVRLDAQGNPIDKTPVVVAANQTNVQLPTAAWNGTSWLVSWGRYGGSLTGYDIEGALVPATGPLNAGTPAIEVSKGPDYEQQPVVLFDGTNHFVVWRAYNMIYGRKLDKTGKPLTDRVTLATSPGFSVYNVSAAFDGTQYLVTWSDYVNGQDILARRVSTNGVPLDAGNLPITSDNNYDDRPRAVWDGSTFVVTFNRSGNLMASRVNQAGGIIDATPITVANGDYYEYGSASDGSGTIVVNRQYGGNPLAGTDVKGVNVGKPPTTGATQYVVSQAANSETDPSVAWNGSTHVSVWLDTRDGRPAIYGAPIGPDGKPGATSRIVSDVKYASELTRPRIVSDGAGFLVVFYAYDSTAGKRGVHGIRLDATGKPDATGVFDIYLPPTPNDFTREPVVAFDGTNYLVVWEHQTNDGGGTTSILGVRLPRTATVAIEKEPLRLTGANPVEARLQPSVAFDGTNYFVAWLTSRASAAGGLSVSHVFGTRVTKEGAPLDGEQAICNAFLLQRAPMVAGDPKNGGFMVVWEDYRTALEAADVYGARINGQGQNLDGTSGMKISTEETDESRPRVTESGDGTNWIVAWRDLRSKQTYDLYGAWVSRAGKVHDPKGLLFSAEGGDEDAPWLNASTDGKLVVAYQRLDPRTGYGSYRIRARSIAAGALVGKPCAKNDDCASRSCVDGVCCSTECGGCGVCNATPGTCTPRAAGSESTACPAYKCKGTLECPNKCETDGDCATNATCDPKTKTCVSRIICIDDHTLKDLTGKTTDCAPFKCAGDTCRANCGSVDDCAAGFVCDTAGRCIQPPGANDGGCASTGGSTGGGAFASASALLWLAAAVTRRKRARS